MIDCMPRDRRRVLLYAALGFARLEVEADLRWVQQQLGHATVGQTADTYGHLQPERHEAAAAGLDRYLSV